MKDDGRLWTLGVLGTLVLAGAVRRRASGSAYLWIDELDHMSNARRVLDHGGYTVIRPDDGQETLISIPYGVYRGVEAGRVEEMDLHIRRLGLAGPDHPLDGGSEADLYKYMPLDVYVAEIPSDLSEVLGYWGRTPEEEIHEMIRKGAAHEVHYHDVERIVGEIASRDAMRRVRILQMIRKAYGYERLMYALHVAPLRMTANQIRKQWPHFVGLIRRKSFRGDTVSAPWMKR